MLLQICPNHGIRRWISIWFRDSDFDLDGSGREFAPACIHENRAGLQLRGLTVRGPAGSGDPAYIIGPSEFTLTGGKARLSLRAR